MPALVSWHFAGVALVWSALALRPLAPRNRNEAHAPFLELMRQQGSECEGSLNVLKFSESWKQSFGASAN